MRPQPPSRKTSCDGDNGKTQKIRKNRSGTGSVKERLLKGSFPFPFQHCFDNDYCDLCVFFKLWTKKHILF